MDPVFRKDLITIEVVAALDKRHFMRRFQVSEGTSVEQAIRLSTIKEFYPETNWSTLKAGIYGKIVNFENILQQSDRIEIYKPLIIDPKEKRRSKIKSKSAIPK